MIASFYLLLLFGVSIAWCIKHWIDNRRYYELYGKIPQIKEGHLPIIGHLLYFCSANNQAMFESLKKVTGPGPSPRKFTTGPLSFVVVDDPNQVQKVLNSKVCTDKVELYSNAFVVKNGLLSASGNVWRVHRKNLEPAFNLNILRSFVPVFNEKSKICIKIMDERANGKEFNVSDIWSAFALDNILATSVGVNKNVQTEKNSKYMTHCMTALQVFGKKIITVWLQIEPIFRWTKYYELEQEHVEQGLKKFAREVIQEREKTFSENTIETNKPQIFIDQLLKLRDVFTREDIEDETNTLIITGFETVATTMSLLSLLIAMYPEVQEKIYDELTTVFESADEEVTEEKIKELKYLDLVMKETMRFWPSVPIIGRCNSEEIEIGGYTLPIGSNISMPVMHIHLDKSIWGEDADKFKPERFLPENIEKIHPYAYIPYSRGPRNCIGYNYAQMSMKVVAAHFFRNFKVSTTLKFEDLHFEFAVVMKVVEGYVVSLERRNFKSK